MRPPFENAGEYTIANPSCFTVGCVRVTLHDDAPGLFRPVVYLIGAQHAARLQSEGNARNEAVRRLREIAASATQAALMIENGNIV